MPLKVTITTPQTSLVHLIEFNATQVRVGRNADCDLRLPYSVVSGHHLTILRGAQDGYQVRDEGSTNGTILNGQRLAPGQAAALLDGSQLRIGEVAMEFSLSDQPGIQAPIAQTSTLMHLMLMGSLGEDSSDFAYVEVIRGPSKGQKASMGLGVDSLVIADTPDATLRVAKMKIALQIERDGDSFSLRALPSQHGFDDMPPTVNGQPLQGVRRLTSEDEIRVGASQFRFIDPLAALIAEFDEVSSASTTATSPDVGATADSVDESAAAQPTDPAAADAATAQPHSSTTTSAPPACAAPRADALGIVELLLILTSVVLVGAVAYLFYLFFAA